VGWNFNNSRVNEAILRPLCEQVDKHFQLPPDRHYRYFATEEDAYLAEEVGRYFRGLHFPTSGTDEISRYALGRYLPFGATNYDHLIYIRKITCADPAGCVVTYSHELQHTIQHERFPRLMKATSILRNNIKTFQPNATEIDIPIEVDANIVSKRVAEEVCGVERVRKFAEEQLRFMKGAGANAQVIRWEYFLNTQSSTAYDFVTETVKLVQDYRGRMQFEINVDGPDWWEGPVDEDDLKGTY
jgi:hypothetical protein